MNKRAVAAWSFLWLGVIVGTIGILLETPVVLPLVIGCVVSAMIIFVESA